MRREFSVPDSLLFRTCGRNSAFDVGIQCSSFRLVCQLVETFLLVKLAYWTLFEVLQIGGRFEKALIPASNNFSVRSSILHFAVIVTEFAVYLIA